jgi:hypothetical protein
MLWTMPVNHPNNAVHHLNWNASKTELVCCTQQVVYPLARLLNHLTML